MNYKGFFAHVSVYLRPVAFNIQVDLVAQKLLICGSKFGLPLIRR